MTKDFTYYVLVIGGLMLVGVCIWRRELLSAVSWLMCTAWCWLAHEEAQEVNELKEENEELYNIIQQHADDGFNDVVKSIN